MKNPSLDFNKHRKKQIYYYLCRHSLLILIQIKMAIYPSDRHFQLLDQLLYMPRTMEELQKKFEVTDRTIHRWIEHLDLLYDIKIKKENDRYKLTKESIDHIKEDSLLTWMLNTISLSDTIKGKETLRDRIVLEDIPSGNENLGLIFKAMENNQWINFDYIKYYNNPNRNTTRYERIEPYCVKLFERRWYVICHTDEKKNEKDNGMRTFSLDQICNLEVMTTTFILRNNFNAKAYFDDVYGITTGMNGPLQTIEVKVDASRANYLRELPLHHSQEETESEQDHSIFTYNLRPSIDFYQALLHHGAHVEVLSPPKVREDFAETVREMAKKYENDQFPTIEVKVDADRANYFREQPLHRSQKETEYEIDHIIFTYKLHPNNDFYQALLQHGTHVEVLSPPEVREYFAKTVMDIAEKYAKKHKKP